MNRLEFGEFLAKRRKDIGITSLEKMAKVSGLSIAMLSLLENGGVKNPGAETFIKIAKGYNLEQNFVINVFVRGAAEDDPENKTLDAILLKIQQDPRLKQYAMRSFSEKIGKETKKFIIKLYEKMTGEKLLEDDTVS